MESFALMLPETCPTRKRSAAINELERIMEDVKSDPVNYNHYYTDTFKKRRPMRNKDRLADSVEKAAKRVVVSESKPFANPDSVDTGKAIELFANRIDPDMDKHAHEEVLDYLYAIYKVSITHLEAEIISPATGQPESLRGECHHAGDRETSHIRTGEDLLAHGHQRYVGRRGRGTF